MALPITPDVRNSSPLQICLKVYGLYRAKRMHSADYAVAR